MWYSIVYLEYSVPVSVYWSTEYQIATPLLPRLSLLTPSIHLISKLHREWVDERMMNEPAVCIVYSVFNSMLLEYSMNVIISSNLEISRSRTKKNE